MFDRNHTCFAGHTFCTVETFDAVAVAVGECAFVTSKLPVFLSLEVKRGLHALRLRSLPYSDLPLDPWLWQMHCSPRNQYRLASMLMRHVGDALLPVRTQKPNLSPLCQRVPSRSVLRVRST